MSTSLPPLAPWLQRVADQAIGAMRAGHLGHATLIAGPERIGKRLLAEHLAAYALCTAPSEAGTPCSQCRGCQLFAARAQMETLEVRPDGSPAHAWGHSAHPDVKFLGFEVNTRTGKPRTEIVIEQIRALTTAMGLTAQLGGAQVVIIEPADAVNWHAWNAILKALEEPQPGRMFWLLSSSPAMLPATIRSRCQRLDVNLPPRGEALDWLQAQGHASPAASQALEAARGHPGLADSWLRGDGMALRTQVREDVRALSDGRLQPAEVAGRWVADGRGIERMQQLAEHALALAAAQPAPPAATLRALATRFDAANRARALLRTTVRADLAVLEALLAWSGRSAAVTR